MHLVSTFGFESMMYSMAAALLPPQGHLPDKNNIKVSCSQIKALILSCGHPKANGEDRQGQGEQPSKDKQDSPYGETGRYEANCY